MLRDALSNTHDERHLRLNRLLDRLCRKWRGNEDHRSIRACLFHAICHGSKHRSVEMRCASFLGIRASNNIGAVVDRALSVERALLASEALDEKLGVGTLGLVLAYPRGSRSFPTPLELLKQS